MNLPSERQKLRNTVVVRYPPFLVFFINERVCLFRHTLIQLSHGTFAPLLYYHSAFVLFGRNALYGERRSVIIVDDR